MAAYLFGASLLAGALGIGLPVAAQTNAATAAARHVASAGNVPKVAAAPVVYGISPNSGPTLGGTFVTIYGKGFTGATDVKFGATSTNCAGGFFSSSDTQIFVSAPPGSLGSVDVVVVGPGGSSATGAQDKFTYVAPTAPVVYGLSPNSGPTTGGTFVQINGTGFATATRALFGGVQAFGFPASDTLFDVTSPPRAAGTVDVTVVNSVGTSATNNVDKFTFAAPGAPVVRAVAPNSSAAAGGVQVLVIGSGFSGATAVHFGTSAIGAGQLTVADDSHIFVSAPAGTAATVVDVTVTTGAGTSAVTNADKFSYIASTAPVVKAVIPNNGPTIGGTQTTITGSGFSGATSVKFGTHVGAGLQVFGDTQINVTSPPGALGTVDVTVTTPAGTSAVSAADRFAYVATPVPVVYAVTPNSGITAGGTLVTIYGAGFTGTTAVHFGATLANLNVAVFGDSQINLTAPAASVGTVDVTVTTPGGTSSANNGDKYTYKPPGTPVVSSVNPSHGAPAGGDSIQLIGSGFTGATAVHFGLVAATTFTPFTDDQMSVTAPAGTDGTTVDITVTTPVGTSATSNADKYNYVTPPVPVVTAVSPSSGPQTGGTTVWISGSGFSGASTIAFAGTPAFQFQVIDDNVIEVFSSPSGSLGVADVTVTTGGGTSATSSADHFTYTAAPVPAVTRIGPSTGTASGGTTVFISGSGFTGATLVNFGPAPAGFFVNDDSLIQATSPMGTAGSSFDVTVQGPGGTSSTGPNDKFTYTAAVPPALPVVTAVSPSSGSTAGGFSTVYISGSHFTGATNVKFGANMAPSWFANDDNLITVNGVPAGSAGTVDVTVVTGAGMSATSANDKYTYVAAPVPVVGVVSPNTGPTAGGTTVWITGTGISPATAVTFGGTAGAILVQASDNLIAVSSPAHVAGTVDIVVTTAAGPSTVTANDHFIYGGPAPSGLQVNGVSPNHGSVSGGLVANRPATATVPASGGGGSVEVDGLGFTGATIVKFGATSTNFNVFSDTQLVATNPGGTSGTVDVTVTVGATTSATGNADKFTFTPRALPIVDAVDPNNGSSSGGTFVVIDGRGLLDASAVKFGSTPATSIFVSSDGQITATSPAGTAGTTVDVTVTTPAGTSATGNADKFKFVTPSRPEVDAVDPGSGSTLGGDRVAIYGTGFDSITGIFFGTASTFAGGGGPGGLLVMSPPGAVGTVDVTLTSPAGTSAISNADKFTYVAPTTPVITGVAPNRGGTSGGRTVRIFGSGLAGASNIHFASNPATFINLVSNTEVDVTSPPGSVGPVDVTVTTPGGTSATGAADTYTYFVAPAPTVTAVSPSSGTAGTAVFITGTGLADVTTVFFGSTCTFAFPIFGNSDTSLEVFAPSGPTGTIDVTVVSPDGTSATSVNDHFTYTAAALPTVTYVAPASGPSGGGTTVYITGTGLLAVTSVMFGSVPALPVSRVLRPNAGPVGGNFFALDDTLIQAQSPPGAIGTVDIRVTSPGGTSTITGADQFAYGSTPVPSVTAVSPNSGPSAGGDLVFVTGSGFTNATQVNFGSAVVAPCTRFFGPTTLGPSSPTIQAPNPAASPSLPIAKRVPIHDPSHPGTKRFATVLVPSVAHPLVTGQAARVSSAGQRGPLFGPQPCISGFVVLDDNHIDVVASAAGSIGTVDVTVTTTGGTSPTSAADHYTYGATPTPAISAISPTGGPSGGGTTVYVTGSHLGKATAVHFGAVAGTITSDPFIFPPGAFGDSLLVAISPPNSGTVDVTVTTPGGTTATTPADRYTYTAAPTPTVTGVAPATGPVATTVFITGSGFLGTSAVKFGTAPAIRSQSARTSTQPAAGGGKVFVISDTLIQVIAPVHALGVVDVTVTTPGGTSSISSADQFTYTASPTPIVTVVAPNSGPVGTVVFITGTGFTGAFQLSFGGTLDPNFGFFSDTLMKAASPAGSGTVDITVTTPGGTSATSAADQFTYTGAPPPVPTVTSVVPNDGPTAGGTSVTITGTNFVSVTLVSFGATSAGFVLNTATKITATSPAHSAGAVDVTVTNASGTSTITIADQFTFGRKGAAQSGTQPPAGRNGVKPAPPPPGPGPRTDAGSQAGTQAARTPAGTSGGNVPASVATPAQASPLIQWLATVVQALFRFWLLLLQ